MCIVCCEFSKPINFLTLKRMHFYGQQTALGIKLCSFHFILYRKQNMWYLLPGTLLLRMWTDIRYYFGEKCISFDGRKVKRTRFTVYHVVLVREKAQVLSLLDECVVCRDLESFLLAVRSRGQQHLHMVPGTGGGLQADDQAVLEDKTEISKHQHDEPQTLAGPAHLGIIEAELCLMTMNSR